MWLSDLKLKTFSSFRKGDYIIMVENVNVSAFDGKEFKDLVQHGFPEKEELNITLSEARLKPTQIHLEGFRNVSEMKKDDLTLELVVKKAPRHGTMGSSQLKDYDIIEKVISIV